VPDPDWRARDVRIDAFQSIDQRLLIRRLQNAFPNKAYRRSRCAPQSASLLHLFQLNGRPDTGWAGDRLGWKSAQARINRLFWPAAPALSAHVQSRHMTQLWRCQRTLPPQGRSKRRATSSYRLLIWHPNLGKSGSQLLTEPLIIRSKQHAVSSNKHVTTSRTKLAFAGFRANLDGRSRS
jgi:hypothetical protein